MKKLIILGALAPQVGRRQRAGAQHHKISANTGAHCER